VNDSIVEDNVWENNLSGKSSLGGDENSGGVGDNGEIVVVIGWDGETSRWESSREESDMAGNCVVAEEFRDLELVESSQVCCCNCNVGWDEDGDWVGGGKSGLSLGGGVCIQTGEGRKVSGHLGECSGECRECWVEDRVDNEDFSVGDLSSCVDWVSVDGDSWVVWGGVVVDAEIGSDEGSEGGVEWKNSGEVCSKGVGNVVEEGLVFGWID